MPGPDRVQEVFTPEAVYVIESACPDCMRVELAAIVAVLPVHAGAADAMMFGRHTADVYPAFDTVIAYGPPTELKVREAVTPVP